MKPLGILIIVVTTLFPAYQLFMLPNISDQIALFSQYLGLAALILMAWGMIMSTRMAGIEALFGGLDRVYVLHKWAGILAMVTILLHDTIDAEMRGLGPETALNELAETLGEISLYGLLILVVISVATFIPYHLWKWTHKIMGAFFAAGTFHFVFIMKPFAMTDPAGWYTGVFCAVGLLAYLWTLLPEDMRPSKIYTISKVEQTGGAVAISMQPKGRAIRPEPGQFGVLRFTGAQAAEPHPFSFSRIGNDGSLRVSIKVLGDFTCLLGDKVEAGQDVKIQGPFGRFRLAKTGQQVWIAGGIGITPFLAWAEALDPGSDPVNLIYCVPTRAQAPHLAEIEACAAAKGNLTLHVLESRLGQRLTPERVSEIAGGGLASAKVAFCGPVGLRRTLQKGLVRYGVTPRQFHYEEFEFRTGIGLKRLAQWILNRRTAASASQKAVET